MLFEVRPTDPVIYAGTAALLLVVSVAASSAPALRAARLDPMQTLREQ
jgi:ABC-type lipoprotein release transport system permease subunit